MKNPYAKCSSKRPRIEEQKFTETNENGSYDLDSSFDGGVDWNEALKVLDQASQSYQERENKAILLNSGNDGAALAMENKPVVSHTGCSSLNENAGAPPRKPPSITSCSPSNLANQYRIENSVNVSGSLSDDRKPAATTRASNVKASTADVLAVSASRALVENNKPVSADTKPNPPVSSTTPATVTSSVNAASAKTLESATSVATKPSADPQGLSIPRPTSWGQSTAASTVANRPLSNESLKPAPVSIAPNASIPRPAAWDAKSITASGNQAATGSRPTSSHGPQTRPSSRHGQATAQSNGLPIPLLYDSARIRPPNDEYRQLLIKNANLSAPLLNGWTLFGHQKKAILKSVVMRRFILALDMGLGKTLIGCVFAKAFQQTFENLKIVIVCPVSLKKEWKRTAEEATGLQVDEDPESTNVTIHSWAKIPSDVPATISNYVVVFDEAHSMQSMATQRTKTALKLVQPDRCIGVLMLTGTPMKNGKPLNLFPLLRAARHPFGDNQKAFERHFCAGHDKSFGNRIVWDANGSSNLVQLRQHVASHLLYMTKEECLDKLPPKTREFKQVPVSSRHQLQHDSALNELAKVYNTTGNFENSGDLVLTAVQRVRQIGSFAKIDATVAVAKLVLLEQPAVVIFTSFVTVAKTVHKQLAEAGWQGEILTGETPSNKRQQLVDNFQVSVVAWI